MNACPCYLHPPQLTLPLKPGHAMTEAATETCKQMVTPLKTQWRQLRKSALLSMPVRADASAGGGGAAAGGGGAKANPKGAG